MISAENIRQLVDNLLQNSDKFLVELMVKPGNKIYIFIDGDQGVSIDHCKEISRNIESRLDRDKEDFELNVSSPGVDYPLKYKRQYPRNTGRLVDVTLQDETIISGRLISVEEDYIKVDTSALSKKKNKNKNKNKGNQGETDADPVQQIPFEAIDETKVRISFK